MIKDTNFYENEIIKAINKIENYTKNMNFLDFSNDEKTFDACCMQLQHIWECWIKLSNLVDINYKNIPFWDMRWFRNKISHDYAWLDDEIVWNTIKISLPDLKNILEK